MKKVFISYSHQQREWLSRCLVPCLDAGGAEILIDTKDFKAGKAVIGQMDEVQAKADINVLVITEDYLSSDYCTHELRKAVSRDPEFSAGSVIPVRRDDYKCGPHEFANLEPLYVDLREDSDEQQWNLLMQGCGAELGVSPPRWLLARDDLVNFLKRKESVNLVVDQRVNWDKLVDVVRMDFEDFKRVDLEDPQTFSRSGLLGLLLGTHVEIPEKPHDLIAFDRLLPSEGVTMAALLRFDLVAEPERREEYGLDLFTALRHLTKTKKRLCLLLVTRRHLLPYCRAIIFFLNST